MAAKKQEPTKVVITAPTMKNVSFRIKGTAPYVQGRFSKKAMDAMMRKMELGSQAKKGLAREPRDFDADYHGAMHMSTDGWLGMPATGFRNALISSCRLVGFAMTRAKLSIFVHADGFDAVDGIPLIRIDGEPERLDMLVKNATGVADIRVRPMWREWQANLRIRYDEDQFSAEDIANLIMRVGMQVGIGQGRPDSENSAGVGWGLFEIVNA